MLHPPLLRACHSLPLTMPPEPSPTTPPVPSVEKLPSTRPVPGAKKVGDHCESRSLDPFLSLQPFHPEQLSSLPDLDLKFPSLTISLAMSLTSYDEIICLV